MGKQKERETCQPFDIGVRNSGSVDIDVSSLFDGSNLYRDDWELDTNTPSPQEAITKLPPDFKIKSVHDIYVLEQYLVNNYTLGTRLFRGHESKEYHIESTLTRLLREEGKSEQDIASAERNGFDIFCKEVFKNEWLKHKRESTDDDLFKISIARHLGFPCRLIDVTVCLRTAVWFAVNNPKHYNEDGEVILIVLDKSKVKEYNGSPFTNNGVYYSHEPFKADDLDDLPLGEQRRLVQNGHFIWVGDEFLLKEEDTITKFAYYVERFTIPSSAKISLAAELYCDVYSGCAYGATIDKIKCIMKNDMTYNISTQNNKQLKQ